MSWQRAGAGSLAILLALVGCGGGAAEPALTGSGPSLTAEIVQLRSDEPLDRIQVSVTNTGAEMVVVERLLVRMSGFDSGGPVVKNSPITPGQVVNLPWPWDGSLRGGR